MRHRFTTACLTAAGVLWLLAGHAAKGPESVREGATISEFGHHDVIPLWATRLSAPYVRVGPDMPIATATRVLDCPSSIDFFVTRQYIAPHFNAGRAVTEIYVRDASMPGVIRHDLDTLLNHSQEAIPVDMGLVWIAEDLDCDGEIELVTQQNGDQLNIYSAPEWTLRAQFVWPGMNVVMHPTLVDLDADRFLEICATPNSLGGTARAVIIDYDSTSGDFVKVADIATPNGAVGQPAVGDFDEDGRMEFIWGNNDFGYELFEWQSPNLAYIGFVGDTLDANTYTAVACRPKPGGVLHALLGYSGPDLPWSYAYYLLEPTGDNTFEIVHIFSELTPFMGEQPSWAADVDCDGLDEMVMGFHPTYRVWEWDDWQSEFIESCSWDSDTYGPLSNWYTLDLNQDSASEWGGVTGHRWFYAFPHPDCVYCDSTGHCPVNDPCFCACPADPVCDAVTNVLDVITAVDVAFRGGQSPHDTFEQCPYALTDVTCNGFTDVLDVVHLVNVAFRSGDPNTEFCDPCP